MPPEGNDFVAIAAGYDHSLALKSDGSIVCWGYNWIGQATPPAGNDFVAITASSYYNLAIRETHANNGGTTEASMSLPDMPDVEGFAMKANYYIENKNP